MRQALGIAVFSGMVGVTFFGIFLTPVFFYVLSRERAQTTVDSPPAQTTASEPQPTTTTAQ